jgi:signal peptidase I
MSSGENLAFRTRRPFLALLLSVAATGLGHIYCGQLAKGLILFFTSFAFAPIIVMTLQQMTSGWAFAAAIGSILLLVAVFLYALMDAFVLAKRIGAGYLLKEYNRWYIYLIFIVVAVSYPANLSQSIKHHLFQAFRIPSVSMVPSILRGDHVFINKAVYQRQAPRRGEVIVFIYPDDRHKNYIKRIVAMPGDTIEVKDHRVYINDQPLAYEPPPSQALSPISKQVSEEVLAEINGPSRYLVVPGHQPGQLADYPRTRVPHGYCFVLGDNRDHSQDSRQFGPLPLADILGRVDFIYLPAATWTRFGPLVN